MILIVSLLSTLDRYFYIDLFELILAQGPITIPPENVRTPEVF